MRALYILLIGCFSVCAQFPPPIVRNQYTTNTTGLITNGVFLYLTVHGDTNLYDWAILKTNDMMGIYTATVGYIPYAINTTNLTNSIMHQSGTNIINEGNLNENGNINYALGTESAHSSGVTNFVADFALGYYTLLTSTNFNLLQSTNRPTANTNTINVVIRVIADGLNVTSTVNASWKTVGSTTWPLVITNGDWGIFSITAFGNSETNVAIAAQYAH